MDTSDLAGASVGGVGGGRSQYYSQLFAPRPVRYHHASAAGSVISSQSVHVLGSVLSCSRRKHIATSFIRKYWFRTHIASSC